MEQELSNKIANSGIKKAKIESDLGMPKNSLSGMISGSRPTPKEWPAKIEEYLDKNKLEVGYIKPDGTAGVHETIPEEFKVRDVELDFMEQSNIQIVNQYCEKNKITVGELIMEHQMWKVLQLSDKQAINKIIQAGDKQVENKHESKKEYDPFKDPTFKAKMGIKDK